MKEFDGEMLRKLRLARGLSMEKLTRLMQVGQRRRLSRSSVYQWESGKCRPSLDALTALADVFQVSLETFFVSMSNYQFVVRAKPEVPVPKAGEETAPINDFAR